MSNRSAEVGKHSDARGESIDEGIVGIARIRSATNILGIVN